MAALGHRRFAMYGTDTGMPIAYAWPPTTPSDSSAWSSPSPLPGISPSPPLLLPPPLNARLWHLAFNQLPARGERTTRRGREAVFFGAEFDASAGTNKLPADAVGYYIDMLAADPDALRGSFEIYRAFPTIIAQDEQRKTRRLPSPSWPSAARRAPVPWSATPCGWSRTTCTRPSPAAVTGSPSKLPRSYWRH